MIPLSQLLSDRERLVQARERAAEGYNDQIKAIDAVLDEICPKFCNVQITTRLQTMLVKYFGLPHYILMQARLNILEAVNYRQLKKINGFGENTITELQALAKKHNIELKA